MILSRRVECWSAKAARNSRPMILSLVWVYTTFFNVETGDAIVKMEEEVKSYRLMIKTSCCVGT